MEANEVQEFANEMKESGEGGESLKRISLGISILSLGKHKHTDREEH